MRKPVNILLILVAIAALVAAAVGFRHRLAAKQTNKKALTVVLEKNAALQARIAGSKTTALAPRKIDADGAAQKNHSGRTKGPWGVSETSAYQQERRKAFEEHKLNDREFGLKYYAALRSDVDTQYGPFYRLQQLTKEQTEALAEALFQRRLRHDKADADKQAGGSEAEARTAKAIADTELAAAAQDALGADLHAQFSLYERQRPAWDYVGNLGSMLSLVDMPLSLEQAARLAGAMANANTSFQNGDAVKMDSAMMDWNAVDAIAADFLTPEQSDFFKNTSVIGHDGGVQSRQIMELNNALKKSGFRGAIGERSD